MTTTKSNWKFTIEDDTKKVLTINLQNKHINSLCVKEALKWFYKQKWRKHNIWNIGNLAKQVIWGELLLWYDYIGKKKRSQIKV